MMLNKKNLLAAIAVTLCVLTYSCKKSDALRTGLDDFTNNTQNGTQGGVLTPPPTPVSTRDTIVDTTVYVAPQVTVSTTTWIDSTNGNSYGIVISRFGVLGYPGSFGSPDTSKITILPNGNLVITLPSGTVVTVTFDPDGTPRYIVVGISADEQRLLDALIASAKKKKKKKLDALHQNHSHSNPDGTSFG